MSVCEVAGVGRNPQFKSKKDRESIQPACLRKTNVLLPTLLFYLVFTFWFSELGPQNSLGCPGIYCVDQAGIELERQACLYGIKGMRHHVWLLACF